jgi:hypothetical protein
MNRIVKTTVYASAVLASFAGAGQSFAVEPGDFQATLRGVTIGIPLGAAPPPGLYAGLQTFMGVNDKGVGQNSAAAGANQGNGLTVFGQAIIPSLVWSTGYNILGANLTFAMVQPIFTVAGLQTNCGVATCNGTPPIAFGNGSFFENMHNTIWSSSLSWNWKNGWFTSAGFNFQGPNGSQYDGTLNQDYWTWSPTFAVAYLSKDWHLSANFEYDIHGASKGHTGTYAALMQAGVALPGGINPGNGYTTGNQLFVDWAAKYNFGKWQFGPVGYFKWQTTADTPGGGYTCASLTATLGASLSCGRANDIAVGAMVGLNLGAANLEVYATDSISTTDDFKGWSVFTRLSFQVWGAEPPPAQKGLITKAK